MRLRPLLSSACLTAALCAGTPVVAQAQRPVQRCLGPDGRAVYTDRRCDDIGAVDRLPPAASTGGTRMFRGGCPRVLSQLVGEIGAAIQSRDVNRLASIYDWRGVSDASASRLLDRLEAVVERPLVDIAPVYPDTGAYSPSPPPPTQEAGDDTLEAHDPPTRGPATWLPSWSPGSATVDTPVDATTSPVDATAPPAPVYRPRPVALRIEQTLSGGATPARTVFGLRRGFGCFWITL